MKSTIVHIPHRVLTAPAKKVTQFDQKLHTLIQQMKNALKATNKPKGVGLAAPQIGEPWRVFITRPQARSEMKVFINPELIELVYDDHTSDEEKNLEGCLSIPNIWGVVRRASQVTIVYQDEQGTKHTETVTGFLATILQHETDHVNGVLFTNRVIEQKGKLYRTSLDENGKEALTEISLP